MSRSLGLGHQGRPASRAPESPASAGPRKSRFSGTRTKPRRAHNNRRNHCLRACSSAKRPHHGRNYQSASVNPARTTGTRRPGGTPHIFPASKHHRPRAATPVRLWQSGPRRVRSGAGNERVIGDVRTDPKLRWYRSAGLIRFEHDVGTRSGLSRGPDYFQLSKSFFPSRVFSATGNREDAGVEDCIQQHQKERIRLRGGLGKDKALSRLCRAPARKVFSGVPSYPSTRIFLASGQKLEEGEVVSQVTSLPKASCLRRDITQGSSR